MSSVKQLRDLSPGDEFRIKSDPYWYRVIETNNDFLKRVHTEREDGHQVYFWPEVSPMRVQPCRLEHDTIPAPPPTPVEEADPTGKDAHAPGAKLDAGKTWDYTVLRGFWAGIRDLKKPPNDLRAFHACCAFASRPARSDIFAACDEMLIYDDATEAISNLSPNDIIGAIKVGSYGAQKYTRYGWAHVEDGKNRYREAFGRHFTKRYLLNEETDPDSGLPHEAHIAWNLLALATLEQPDFDPNDLVQLDGKKNA